MRKHFVALLTVVAIVWAVGSSLPHAAEPAKPNVLFVVSDDLNNDLGVYGAPVKSPHADRLAARGVTFERAYCQYPLCSPSRSSFLTGRRPNATGVLTNPGTRLISPHFREKLPDAVTLPQFFTENGWFAARVGKLYHYGVPRDIGTSSLDDYRSWELTVNPRGRDREVHDRIFSLLPGQFGGTVCWLADDGADAEHTDGIAASEAVRLLERFKTAAKPFFLAVGFYRPHTPYVAPKKYFDMYPAEKIVLPPLSEDDRAQKPEAAYVSLGKPQAGMTDAQRREAIQAYRASTTFMDAQFGIILDALDRLKLADSTIVVFTSDHGYHLYDHGLWQKMSAFEASARVPLVMAGPGIQKGKRARGLAELVDLYPTLADLAGLKAPGALDGTSLRPILSDPAARVKDAAFTQVRDGYAVRTDRWRYIEWAQGSKGAQLYNMERDPRETTNLAADPAHASVVAEHKALLSGYRGGS